MAGELGGYIGCAVVSVEDEVHNFGTCRFMKHGLTSNHLLVDGQTWKQRFRISYQAEIRDHGIGLSL